MFKSKKQRSFFLFDNTLYPINLDTLYFKYRAIGKGLPDNVRDGRYKRWIDVQPFGITLRFLSSFNEDIAQDNIQKEFELLYSFLELLISKYTYITEDVWETELSQLEW